MHKILQFAFLILFSLCFVPFPSHQSQQTRVKRQGGATVLTKAWNEALPGVIF
jgi:hypothetical protein